MVQSNLFVTFFLLISVVSILSPLVSSHAIPNDDSVSDLRDLYAMLLSKELPASDAVMRFGHQMERKGGRSPALRLRFGRRSDPAWANAAHQLPMAEMADGL